MLHSIEFDLYRDHGPEGPAIAARYRRFQKILKGEQPNGAGRAGVVISKGDRVERFTSASAAAQFIGTADSYLKNRGLREGLPVNGWYVRREVKL